MLNRIELRLAFYNVAVFVGVLTIFSLVLYGLVKDGLYEDMRGDLTRLADGVISSIDFDEDHERHHGIPTIPDALDCNLPSQTVESLDELRMQWFAPDGKLLIEKGTFRIDLPLKISGGFEYPNNPRAMVLTKAVNLDGKLLGYVRVVQPMIEADRAIEHLQMALTLGVLIASIISGAGITFLIRKSMQPLYKNLHQLKQFTADASHELRTPVMAITTNSSVALKYPDGMRSADKEKFEMILGASKQMGRLVDDLLKLDGADKELDSMESVTELGSVFTAVWTVVSWMEREKNISSNWKVGKDLFVKGSEEDLQHVFCNIFENALRYTPNGGSVSIEAFTERNQVIVKVSDTGIGIDQADLARVFDRFWRADKARNAFEGGNGLGLAIVKTIIERLDGRIELKSEIGKGSVFTVHLPKAQKSPVA